MAELFERESAENYSSRSWTPTVGQRFFALIDRLSDDRKEKTADEAMRVLGRCVKPKQGISGSVSQLVLGQVQSGKTSNMLHTIALAADNGVPLIIVLTGTKRILDSQTSRDLMRQLQSDHGGGDPWFNFREVSPSADTFKSKESARSVLFKAREWFDGAEHSKIGDKAGFPLCVFLLKNVANMRTFTEVMQELNPELRDMPVLIIDDEADQAGPDAGSPDRPSSTNQQIQNLRSMFPQHSYLLYTATPQAPLLSQLGNALSPDWVTNLHPGPGYVGVQKLFDDKSEYSKPFIRIIPAEDVENFKDTGVSEVPPTLHKALAQFFIRTALARSSTYELHYGTMMIHTSANNKPMVETKNWVNEIIDQWKYLFESQEDPDFVEEWEQLFEPAWTEALEDLTRAGKSTGFDMDSLTQSLKHLFEVVNIKVLNQSTSNFLDSDWTGSSAWILIGGEKLSRGFRVENLLVTYMPREKAKSDSALDTVQQRGRFFGYRLNYIELLKGWLPEGIVSAFKTYSDHDKMLRAVMEKLEVDGLPLKAWQRVILTNPGFKATRSNVVKLGVKQFSLTPGEIAFSQTRLFCPGVADRTRGVYLSLLNLCKSKGLVPASEYGTGGQLYRAFAAEISYSALALFLLDYHACLSGADSFELSRLLDQLSQIDDQDSEHHSCLVIFHESRDKNSGEAIFQPDKRGPAGSSGSLQEEYEVSESTRISGLSRSNAEDQRPKFHANLTAERFLLHVYLFDVYKVPVKEIADDLDLFSVATPAIQVSVPRLKLMSGIVSAE